METLIIYECDFPLDHKQLERDLGFLCHISWTHPAMFPYLKGFYDILNLWRIDRDSDGWKLGKMAWIELMSRDAAFEKEAGINIPFEDQKRWFIVKRQGE